MTKPGVWRHWQGGLYRVLHTVHNSTNAAPAGETMVVYVSLKTGRMNVREECEFHERVWLADGSTVLLDPEVEDPRAEGQQADRFMFIHENPSEELLRTLEVEWRTRRFERESGR